MFSFNHASRPDDLQWSGIPERLLDDAEENSGAVFDRYHDVVHLLADGVVDSPDAWRASRAVHSSDSVAVDELLTGRPRGVERVAQLVEAPQYPGRRARGG